MPATPQRRAENLAFCFQELLTVGERLRANRQVVQDAESFRFQIREALKMADTEARKRGYTGDDVQLAIFATVAFLDESILNLRNPVFADWPRRPLQEELFGHHVAGEIFFQHLSKLLARDESQETADLLEVYYLCLLLGFAGRYSMGGRGELKAAMDSAGEKIRRIRQLSPEIAPMWSLPGDAVQGSGADPWVKRLIFAAAGCLLIALLLFGIYKWDLGSRVDEMESLAALRRYEIFETTRPDGRGSVASIGCRAALVSERFISHVLTIAAQNYGAATARERLALVLQPGASRS